MQKVNYLTRNPATLKLIEVIVEQPIDIDDLEIPPKAEETEIERLKVQLFTYDKESKAANESS